MTRLTERWRIGEVEIPGRIVLAPQKADMSQFKHGDLVSVRGDLVHRPTAAGMMPIYRITHASLIERANG